MYQRRLFTTTSPRHWQSMCFRSTLSPAAFTRRSFSKLKRDTALDHSAVQAQVQAPSATSLPTTASSPADHAQASSSSPTAVAPATSTTPSQTATKRSASTSSAHVSSAPNRKNVTDWNRGDSKFFNQMTSSSWWNVSPLFLHDQVGSIPSPKPKTASVTASATTTSAAAPAPPSLPTVWPSMDIGGLQTIVDDHLDRMPVFPKNCAPVGIIYRPTDGSSYDREIAENVATSSLRPSSSPRMPLTTDPADMAGAFQLISMVKRRRKKMKAHKRKKRMRRNRQKDQK